MKIKITHNKAFTLIELLLGLAIGAIISLSVYNMFWSSVKLDDRMRRTHDIYMELLLADQALSHDLENAITLDFSANYPDAIVFDGDAQGFSFLTQTPKGIKHVHYYIGQPGDDPLYKAMIGRVVNPLSSSENNPNNPPVEFLFRQESNMADWLNGTSDQTSTQVVAAGIKKDSFDCRYAPFSKELHKNGETALVYKDSWQDAKSLPMAVSCSFVLYDVNNPQANLMFKRDIFLAPVSGYYNEQQ